MKAGWRTEPLGDLCEFQRGLTYAKSDEVDVSDNIVLRATNIDLATNLLDFDELKYINDKVVVPDSKKVRKDSLMICTASGSKSHLGKVAYIDDDYGYAFGGFMGMVTAKHGLVPKYLFHLMTSVAYKDFIGELSDGANINNLKFDDLRQFPVPHPSLGEQQRIVGILDKAFEGIATAKANAEQNLQNARALFESYLQSVFTQRGEGWDELTKLEDLTDPASPITYGVVKPGAEGEITFIRGGDLARGRILKDQLRTITKSVSQQYRRTLLRGGELLISLVGQPGQVAVVPPDLAGANIARQVGLIRLKEGMVADFVRLFLQSPVGQTALGARQSGSVQQVINLGELRQVRVPVPTAKLQSVVVTNLEAISAETQRLELIYQQKRDALDALKKSLLHEAFAGNL